MLEKIKLSQADTIFIRDGNFGETPTVGCGSVNNDGHLYYIDMEKMEALRLPDKYKDMLRSQPPEPAAENSSKGNSVSMSKYRMSRSRI